MYVVTAVYNLYLNFENYALNLWIMEQLGTLRAWGLCSEKNTCTNLIASSVITECFLNTGHYLNKVPVSNNLINMDWETVFGLLKQD